MSVRICNRNGCENIMCDRGNPEYGYICDKCFEELIHHNGYIEIQTFMDSPKGSETIKDNREYYENIFPKDL